MDDSADQEKQNSENPKTVYTNERKKRIADRLSKITNKRDLVKIFEIIKDNNDGVTETGGGMYMYFHKLRNDQYANIEKELKRVNKKKKYYNDSESMSEKNEYTPYVKDEFPSQEGVSPKLKYSNREKNLIKKRRYTKNINLDNDSDTTYAKFDITTFTDSEKHHS